MRGSLGDIAPAGEHHDPVREAHDHPHDVLHHDDGGAAVADPPDEFDSSLRLYRIEAGYHLIEEKQGRAEREGSGDFEAFPAGSRQRSSGSGCKLGEAHHLDDLSSPPHSRMAVGVPQVRTHQEVLHDGEAREWFHDLECAPDAELGTLVRGCVRDLATLEEDASTGNPHRATHQVEEGGLARAVRADEAHDLPFRNGKLHVVDRHEAAKQFTELFRAQDLRHGVPSAPLSPGRLVRTAQRG